MTTHEMYMEEMDIQPIEDNNYWGYEQENASTGVTILET